MSLDTMQCSEVLGLREQARNSCNRMHEISLVLPCLPFFFLTVDEARPFYSVLSDAKAISQTRRFLLHHQMDTMGNGRGRGSDVCVMACQHT
jgi:hypothetical protein